MDPVSEEKFISLDEQIKRFFSHLDSEQRRLQNHEKRLDSVEIENKRTGETLDKYDKLMFNSGQGILFKLDRIEQQTKYKDKGWEKIAVVISLLLSTGSLILLSIQIINQQ